MSSHARKRAARINSRAKARSDWSKLTAVSPPLCYKFGAPRWSSESKKLERTRAIFISDTELSIALLKKTCMSPCI